MKIKIAGLKDGNHTWSFQGGIEEIGLREPFIGGYTLNINLDKSIHQLYLKADLEVSGSFICDRCGKDIEKHMPVKFDVVYLFEQPKNLVDESSVVFLHPEADQIDIGSELYDYAHLAVPMKLLCDEDCKGLCSRCGQDLNIKQCECAEKNYEDERWSPLRELKSRLENN